jgi:hypothetical protein
MTTQQEIDAQLAMLRQEVIAVFDRYASNTPARIGVLIGALISVTQHLDTEDVVRLAHDLHAVHQRGTRQ